jgi:glucose 1-dehydrogenase
LKAVAVIPGRAGSVHLTELDAPRLDEVPNRRGVLVRVLRVGLDGTDREINAAAYGEAPPRSDFLVLGHESLGVVEEVGPAVTELKPGDHVVCIVRRPGGSIYDQIGRADFTTDSSYQEHGISLLHGFLTERYVDSPEYLVLVPGGLTDVGVLLEPTSVTAKGSPRPMRSSAASASGARDALRYWGRARSACLRPWPCASAAGM